MTNSLAIGVDLGGTKIASALVESTGRVVASRQTLTLMEQGPGAVLDRIAAEAKALIGTQRVLGVGIGSPGLVNSKEGTVRRAVNLRWTEVRVAEELSRRLGGLSVTVENDANASAVGEGVFGSARGSENFVVLTVGSGLGSGAVAGGQLIAGRHWMAADLGHFSLDPTGGRPCLCGRRGCAETVASGPGLLAVTRSILSSRAKPSRLQNDDQLTPGRIVAAAEQGDEAARLALAQLGQALGHIAAVAAAVVDPDVIVIGGGLGVACFELIRADVEREMRQRLPVYFFVETHRELRASTLISSAVGAASLVWKRLG